MEDKKEITVKLDKEGEVILDIGNNLTGIIVGGHGEGETRIVYDITTQLLEKGDLNIKMFDKKYGFRWGNLLSHSNFELYTHEDDLL